MTRATQENIQTCKDCCLHIKYDKLLIICGDKDNEHYQHVMHIDHPSCGIFFYDVLEQMLERQLRDKKVLDKPVKV